MSIFRILWKDPIKVTLQDDLTLFSMPLPGSGVIAAYIMQILNHYDITPPDVSNPVVFQRIIEAFKWAYAARSNMGDPADPEITQVMNEVGDWICPSSV